MADVQVQKLDSPPEMREQVSGALIDGSITYNIRLSERAEMSFTLPTPAGESPPFYLVRHQDVPFWYIHFHGVDFMTASANVQVGFTRTWYTLYCLGVRDVISGAAAGSIHPDMRPGDAVVVDDFLDFSTHRPRSMQTEIWEKLPWIGAAFVPPMCPELTGVLRDAANGYAHGQVFPSATLGQFEGHRFESPAEIRRAKAAGADVVHHHQASEAIYARELGIHYGAFNIVSNIAAGLAADWGESWLSPEQYKAATAACADIMLDAMVRAAQREAHCTVCPVPKDQPVVVTEVVQRPVYR
jgi:5'-methylthioadenosine phosphorylase